MEQSTFKKLYSVDGLIYASILVLIVILRYNVLINFGFKYTDSDQSIMWLGLKDYSNGLFYEPRFYGQAYNTMLEALFAVPLYKMGIPIYKALPLITSILTLAPYIIISLGTFINKSTKISLVILSIPLLLPVEYSLVTVLSRGFVTGIFISALGCMGIFYPKSKISFLVAGFFAVLAYSINANSILLSCLYLLYLLGNNIKNKQFYLFSSIGIIAGFIIHYSIAHFYILHPYNNLHTIQLDFSFNNIVSSFNQLDLYFNNVVPVFWGMGFLVLLLFIAIAIYLYVKRQYIHAISVGIMPFLIIITLGINKVHDGTESIFFSYSRMYLSLPVLLGLSLSFLADIQYSNKFYLYLILPCVCFICQLNFLNAKIETQVNPSKNHIVSVIEVSKLMYECNNLKNICTKYHIQLVIISNHWNYNFFNYGCPSCIDSFPKTLRPSYERRTWRLIEDEQYIYKSILIIDTDRNFTDEFDFIKKIENRNDLYMIKNNHKYTMDLLKSLDIPIREYK